MAWTGRRGWPLILTGTIVAGASLSPVMVSRAVGMQFPTINGTTGQSTGRTTQPGIDPARPEDDVPFGTREIQARQLKKMRAEHQKQVLADTARLVQLATTLKEEADTGAKLPPGAVKNVDEIAKLAKRLSERIKNQ